MSTRTPKRFVPAAAESVSNGRLQRVPNEDHAKDERDNQRETHAER
jgi:hypothetical protein